MSRELHAIGSFGTLVEADAFRLRLEAEGIRSVLADEAVVGMNWLLGNAVGGVKVLVAETDVPRAQQILEHESAAARSRLSQDPKPDWNCLRCGETISGEFETCWACGASRDGEIDPDFETQSPAEEPKIDSVVNTPIRTSPNPEAPMQADPAPGEIANPFRSPSGLIGNAPVEQGESENSFDFSETDEIAFRAWKASVFGLAFCPPVLQFYSMSLLASLAMSERPLSRKASRRCLVAWIINLIVVGFIGAGLIVFVR